MATATVRTGHGFFIVGGPTVVFDFGGLRFLSEPTFDAPTDYGLLRKTEGPAAGPEALGPFDVALISHCDHKDNLDDAGRAAAAGARSVITTHQGAQSFGEKATGLAAGQSVSIGDVTVCAVPALHGPEDGAVDERGFVNCEVIGFVLTHRDATLYISGDNTSMDNVRGVADRFGPVDHAILHAGRASVPAKFDGRPLSMTGAQAAEAARILGARQVVAVHQTQWAHFTEGPDQTRRAFDEAGLGAILDPAPVGEWGQWR